MIVFNAPNQVLTSIEYCINNYHKRIRNIINLSNTNIVQINLGKGRRLCICTSTASLIIQRSRICRGPHCDSCRNRTQGILQHVRELGKISLIIDNLIPPPPSATIREDFDAVEDEDDSSDN